MGADDTYMVAKFNIMNTIIYLALHLQAVDNYDKNMYPDTYQESVKIVILGRGNFNPYYYNKEDAERRVISMDKHHSAQYGICWDADFTEMNLDSEYKLENGRVIYKN